MAETHVLSALLDKRSELLGIIDYHRKEIKKIIDDLSHIDASIKIFNPEYNLRKTKAKKYIQTCKYFRRGERARLVLEVLRDADKPLTNKEIVDIIKKLKNINENISPTIYNSLKTYKKNGVIESIEISVGVNGWKIKECDETRSQFKLL